MSVFRHLSVYIGIPDSRGWEYDLRIRLNVGSARPRSGISRTAVRRLLFKQDPPLQYPGIL